MSETYLFTKHLPDGSWMATVVKDMGGGIGEVCDARSFTSEDAAVQWYRSAWLAGTESRVVYNRPSFH
jgi:hypothetical protein